MQPSSKKTLHSQVPSCSPDQPDPAIGGWRPSSFRLAFHSNSPKGKLQEDSDDLCPPSLNDQIEQALQEGPAPLGEDQYQQVFFQLNPQQVDRRKGTYIEHEEESFTANDYLKKDSVFPVSNFESAFSLSQLDKATATLGQSLLKKRSLGEVVLNRSGCHEEESARKKLSESNAPRCKYNCEDLQITDSQIKDHSSQQQQNSQVFDFEDVPQLSQEVAPTMKPGSLHSWHEQPDNTNILESKRVTRLANGISKSRPVQEEALTETDQDNQLEGELLYIRSANDEIDEANLEKQLTVCQRPKRGRKKENWDIYLKSAMNRINANRRKLETAKEKGDNSECARLRNMISAQQSRLKKKFEVRFLYNLHQERDSRLDKLKAILSNRLAKHPDLVTQITEDIETQICGEGKAPEPKKRKAKRTTKDLERAIDSRLKSREEEMTRYQHNAEKDEDDYIFEQEFFDLEVNREVHKFTID